MGITFSAKKESGYFYSVYSGEITDRTMYDSYAKWLQNSEWVPGANELINLRDANLDGVTSDGLVSLDKFVRSILSKHGVEYMKTAVFAPEDLPFGVARVYSASAFESPEEVQVFRKIDDAQEWIEKI